MPDIMIRCPVLGTTVSTGLSTEAVVFTSLPANISVPVRCPACKKMHKWKPQDAWVQGELKPKGTAQILKGD
jgi:hypothetical protein